MCSMMSKSRLGNKSAFLCAVLIVLANKFDCFLIKLRIFSVFPAFPGQKLSPISADKPGTVFNHLCKHFLTLIQAYSD